MAYALIAMATAFGAVSAWFIFGEKDSVEQPLANGQKPTAAPDDDLKGPRADPPPPPDEDGKPVADVPGDPDKPGQVTGPGNAGLGKGRVSSTGKGNDADEKGRTAEKTKPPKPCTPDDPFCDKGPSGPSATGNGNGSGESGQGLSQQQAASVVGRYKGSLMRRCRSMVTKGGAKVAATITVGSSGAVQSVNASGGKKYPGLASCVKSRILNWSFPASGGSTTVNVSFNFL